MPYTLADPTYVALMTKANIEFVAEATGEPAHRVFKTGHAILTLRLLDANCKGHHSPTFKKEAAHLHTTLKNV